MTSDLLTAKELAAELKRHTSYVRAMVRQGFRGAGYRYTLTAALAWLQDNPTPRARRHRKTK